MTFSRKTNGNLSELARSVDIPKKERRYEMTDRKKEFFRAVKYTLFSASAGLIQIGSFSLFSEVFHLVAWQSHLFSLILSVLWNFTLNRKFTFHAANNIPIAMLKLFAFYLVFTPLSTWWTSVLAKPDGFINAYIVEALTMLINFVLEYLYMRYFVFGKHTDTQGHPKNEGGES